VQATHIGCTSIGRFLLIGVLLAGIGAYALWQNSSGAVRGSGNAKSEKKDGKDGKGGRGGTPAETPVDAVKAKKGNIGVYDNGLGIVTPYYTVTIKSRVDGELIDIHYKEGDLVHRGDLLAEIDPRPYRVQLEQAEGQLAKDTATLENARVDLARYQTLLKQNAVQEQVYATQQATVRQDEGVIKSDQGAVDNAKLNLTYCQITAPITGRIGLRLVDPGNIVHASDANGLLVITQVQPITILFTISEDQLPPVLQRLKHGEHLRADAYDREGQNRIATGTLTSVDNQIDPTTGTLRLRSEFENKNEALYPNQFVNVRLLVQEKRGVTLVPTAAIQRTTNSLFVFLVKPDSTVTIRQIQEGVTEGDQTEVTSGLNPGDEVVMTGVDRLAEGSKGRNEPVADFHSSPHRDFPNDGGCAARLRWTSATQFHDGMSRHSSTNNERAVDAVSLFCEDCRFHQ